MLSIKLYIQLVILKIIFTIYAYIFFINLAYYKFNFYYVIYLNLSFDKILSIFNLIL